MLLVIAVSMTDEQMNKLALERGYSEIEVITVENPDGTRSMKEIQNKETPQDYLTKMYEDLVVSDIVNTVIGYKNRVGEEIDAKAEKLTRTEVQETVSVNVV